jgi:TIR domain
MTEKIKIFISYSHNDTQVKIKLCNHLSLLLKSDMAEIWADHKIEPGQQWAKEIADKLAAADVILLLLSSNFISSEYCYDNEMTAALEKHKEGLACVIPVLLEEFDWQNPAYKLPVKDIEMIPKDEVAARIKPLSHWVPEDTGYTLVARSISNTLPALQKNLRAIKNRNADSRKTKIETMVSESKIDEASSELMDLISIYGSEPEVANDPKIKKFRTNSIMLKGKCTAFRNNLEKEFAANPTIMNTLESLMIAILDLLENVYEFIQNLFGIRTNALNNPAI